MIRDAFKGILRTALPNRTRRWLRNKQKQYRLQWPRVGRVDLGQLRRLTPISTSFGFDRGLPIDRYYIERFLAANSVDIRGRVLEMGDSFYTRTFGGERVARSEVLHVVEGNPKATIVADLTCADQLPPEPFDCIICTQTLQMIYDARGALRHLHRLLKPGGVLLMTAHGISKIARREGIDDWGEYWHFTSQSLNRLMAEAFSGAEVSITPCGNVLAAVAYLHGLAAEELTAEELNCSDPDYEVLLTVRAVKAVGKACTSAQGGESRACAPPGATRTVGFHLRAVDEAGRDPRS
jgi:SAM-dependent methyltransferase